MNFTGMASKVGKRAMGAVKTALDSYTGEGKEPDGGIDISRKVGKKVGGYMKRRNKANPKTGGPTKPASQKGMY